MVPFTFIQDVEVFGGRVDFRGICIQGNQSGGRRESGFPEEARDFLKNLTGNRKFGNPSVGDGLWSSQTLILFINSGESPIPRKSEIENRLQVG
jgi:hypothetical protein